MLVRLTSAPTWWGRVYICGGTLFLTPRRAGRRPSPSARCRYRADGGLRLLPATAFHTRPLPLFFFSSRRRHTRFDCDWSSDVCSSDLVGVLPPQADGGRIREAGGR